MDIEEGLNTILLEFLCSEEIQIQSNLCSSSLQTFLVCYFENLGI